MAREIEDWSAWDHTLADGLDDIPWDQRTVKRVAETTRKYPAARSKSKRAKK
jgi:hypothetical protein